jgi:hypothetical protein
MNKIIKEMAYPVSFSMEEMMGLTSFTKRLKYAREHLKRIAEGSSRVAFKVDDEKVLKVAKNNKGIAQNEVESDYSLINMYPNTFAHVFEVDTEFRFLEMELAYKVTPTKFQSILGFSIENLVDLLGASEYRINGYKGVPSFYKDADVGLEHLYDIPWVYDLIDYAGNFDIPMPGDLGKLNSYGIVKRESKDTIVLIDYGFNRAVWQAHYS